MRAQPVDQAGFRSGFSCDDHLQAMVMLIERSAEFNAPLWVCAIDFRKAFDSIEHLAIWKALRQQGVDERYVTLLIKLYENQVGHVCCGVESKSFPIQRGTKQGDPLSPALFNAVLESVFSRVQPSWRQRGYGIKFSIHDQLSLTNLRFADDVLLLATSRSHLVKMIEELLVATHSVGLEVHTGKTKILTNDVHANRSPMKLQSACVE
eukprot:11263927-Karenia_brevis.AAC.1